MCAEEQAAVDHTVVLEGESIRLRPFVLADAEEVCEAVCASKTEIAPWMPWCHEEYSIADTREFLGSRAEAFQKTGEYTFAIVEKASGRIVGATGLNEFDPATLSANHGYWLRTSATGHGYATQAARLVLRWGLETLRLERIEIMIAKENTRSHAVAKRAGAVREGLLRRSMRIGGVQHDAIVYSVIRADLGL
ncbi:MAG: N-acetyltransferase [Planctomycetota bacterium]|nr:MAG: N-acetyltransferase [Planctomycetota bacterium]